MPLKPLEVTNKLMDEVMVVKEDYMKVYIFNYLD